MGDLSPPLTPLSLLILFMLNVHLMSHNNIIAREMDRNTSQQLFILLGRITFKAH